MPFATPEELAVYLGDNTIDSDQADLLLELASATIRDFTGQTIDLVTDDEFEMRGSWSTELWLPQRPVIDIGAIEFDGQTVEADSYRWNSFGPVSFLGGSWTALDRSSLGWWGGRDILITGTYTHGYAEIPTTIKGVCLELVKRALRNPDAGAVSQEALGTYSISYAKTVSLELSPGEQRRLRRYMRRNVTLPVGA